jgi:hypothetical protein
MRRMRRRMLHLAGQPNPDRKAITPDLKML